MKLYHVSSAPNLKVLEPHVSTHGKSYVYATSNLELALFFGSKKSAGDFDGMYGTEGDKPFFYEAYEGALKRRFDGATCYIYEVDPSTFEGGKTSFGCEMVSTEPVKVKNCTEVSNLYQHLLDLNEKGRIDLHFFEDTSEYKKLIHDHIVDRIVSFNILDRKNSWLYGFCQEKFPSIIDELTQNHTM